MNQKQILSLLQDDPNDVNVMVACDWLVKRKPTSKLAHKLLQELLGKPHFESKLDWLADWLKEGSWDGLWPALWDIRSETLYAWTIQLGEDNPNHPQVSDLWQTLVLTYRNAEGVEKAARWFDRHGQPGTKTFILAADLIALKPSDKTIEKAEACLNCAPPDSQLIVSLIKHVGSKRAIRSGLAYLKNQDHHPVMASLVAAALLANDSKSHLKAVKEFLAPHWHAGFPYAVLQAFVHLPSEAGLPILIDWIETHTFGAEQIVWELLSEPTQEIVDYAWAWFLSNHSRTGPSSIDVLCSLLTASNLRIPDTAVKFAQNWLESNKGDKKWVEVTAALVLALPVEEREALGLKFLEEAALEDHGEILLAMIHPGKDRESTKLAKAWLKKFPTNKYAAGITLNLLQNDPDAETIAQARHYAVKINGRLDGTLLSTLVRMGDLESIEKAKGWLSETSITRRHDKSYFTQGQLLRALLESGHRESEILIRAERWLQMIPMPREEKDYREVKEALKTACANLPKI